MIRILSILCVVLVLTGCSTYYPNQWVSYISLRPTQIKDFPVPNDADIAVYYSIDENFNISVMVENLTDDVLNIDQTKSFYINPQNVSTSYFDPSIRTKSNTTSYSTASGGSFNLGGLSNALGIGGVAGSLMRATTLGRGNSETNTSTYTEVMADMPVVSIGPRGKMAMSKTFKIYADMNQFTFATPETSPTKFAIAICYSFNQLEDPQIIKNEFYFNSYIVEEVINRRTNDAVRGLINKKPNATLEPWYKVCSSRGDGFFNQTIFLNYQ